MTAMTSTMRPPPPTPCRARVPMSCAMFCEAPASIEPMTNTTIDVCSISLRP